MVKKIFLFLLTLGVILLTVRIYFSNSNIPETRQSAEFIEYKPIDKLFTAFAYVPIIDYERGYLKRDFVSKLKDDKSKQIIKGYCYRQYDVGIGYDNTSDLFQEFQEAACQGSYEKLPVPVILSVNAFSSEVFGEYTRMDCDSWDMENSEGRKSQEVILKQLQEDGQWDKIVANSQKALSSFIRVYCP